MTQQIKIEYTPVFTWNLAARERVVVNIGGARSSKSYSMAQLFIYKMFTETGKVFGITRKTFPALRISTYRVFISLLKQYGLYEESAHNKTENSYCANGNILQFFSLDDPEKIKSTEFNYIWMEEANEFTHDDFMISASRLSGHNTLPNQIYLTLNPSEATGWIPEILLKERGVRLIKSTFRDNPFCDENYIKWLEEQRDKNPQFYRVYALGEWGASENKIYPRYEFVDAMPQDCEEIIYGLDFGFNNPTAIIKIGLRGDEAYLSEVAYGSEILPNRRIEILKAEIDRRKNNYIFADSADPASIAEIFNEGLNVHPAKKDVLAGISCVKMYRLKIVRGSENIIREIQSYNWKLDKAGRPLDEPIKCNDHAMDAIRYALFTYTHMARPDFLTAKK